MERKNPFFRGGLLRGTDNMGRIETDQVTYQTITKNKSFYMSIFRKHLQPLNTRKQQLTPFSAAK